MRQNSGDESKDANEESFPTCPVSDVVDSDIIEPTSHELESKASSASWAGIRSHMLTVVTEAMAMPSSQICCNCELSASFRCQQCGPL